MGAFANMRIRITKNHDEFKVGDIVIVNEELAKFLIKTGYAIQSKDMTINDYQTKDLNGNPSRQRIN